MEKLKKILFIGALLTAATVFYFWQSSNSEATVPVIKSSMVEAGDIPETKERIENIETAITEPENSTRPVQSPTITPKPINKNPAVQASPPVSSPVPAPPPAPETCESGGFSAQFLCLINNYRAGKGLKKLTYDSALSKVAFDYSVTMNQTGNFSHTGPDGSKFYERCAAQNTTCYAENLAMGFTSAQHLFDLWQASPGHNKNMVGPYGQIGLGLSGSYATTLFR